MNLFDPTLPQKGENFTTLLEHKKIKVVRIVSSDDVESMEYRQEEDEWVVIIEGEATLLIDEREQRLKRGDSILIPAHTPHRVLKTAKGTIWLALHIF